MKKVSAKGERLWRDWRVRVVIPGQKDIIWHDRIKQARHGWTADQLDAMMEQVADHLEKRFPTIEFRLVELAPNAWNFVYAGRKDNMDSLNQCPEVARSAKLAENVCARDGHKLSTYQNGFAMTPQGPQPQVINFCSACGFSLSEVRGEIDNRINAAVAQGVNERMAAVAAAAKGNKAPAGEPGSKVAEIPQRPTQSDELPPA